MGVNEKQDHKGNFYIWCHGDASVRWNVIKRNQYTHVFNITLLMIGVF